MASTLYQKFSIEFDPSFDAQLCAHPRQLYQVAVGLRAALDRLLSPKSGHDFHPKLLIQSTSKETPHKRLFFGLQVVAPWPNELPSGRLIAPDLRHLTLAFLGDIDATTLLSHLDQLPPPPFDIGPAALFDRLLFLPKRHPRVAAWRIDFGEQAQPIASYAEQLCDWLETLDYPIKRHLDFLPHVTLARAPFKTHEWKEAFTPLPLITTALHLYESTGNLTYAPIWSHSLLPALEEIEHTADLAYLIRGESLDLLCQHAQLALAFRFPAILPYLERGHCASIEEIVAHLNDLIARADQEIGVPFKAVSHHGEIEKKREMLQWEMIVDV